jgi:hypothetical protein
MYTRELIQAVSDWQRGADRKDILRQALQTEALKLPAEFRTTDAKCYRRIDIDPTDLMIFGTQCTLPETASSWTKSYSVARNFKGGVPPLGYQGVIFSISPPQSVILDMDRLFSKKAFRKKVHEIQGEIVGYEDGIKRYSDSEREVLIELPEISMDCLYARGGYSSDKATLASKLFGHDPSETEMRIFEKAALKGNLKAGPAWIDSPEAMLRISKKLVDAARSLNAGKAAISGPATPTAWVSP